AARYLAREGSRTMALLGSGWQASAHFVTLCRVLPLERVRVYSPTAESRRRFVEELKDAPVRVEEATGVESAIEGADVITCATNSITPVFPGEWLRPGVHVSCVKPCELDTTAYRRADPLIIHWREAKP